MCKEQGKLGIYGYPTTYATNNFHHYCLTFPKEVNAMQLRITQEISDTAMKFAVKLLIIHMTEWGIMTVSSVFPKFMSAKWQSILFADTSGKN